MDENKILEHIDIAITSHAKEEDIKYQALREDINAGWPV